MHTYAYACLNSFCESARSGINAGQVETPDNMKEITLV
jgi:hypothetical protein